MPQRTFYLSRELEEQVRAQEVNVGEVCRTALRWAVSTSEAGKSWRRHQSIIEANEHRRKQ